MSRSSPRILIEEIDSPPREVERVSAVQPVLVVSSSIHSHGIRTGPRPVIIISKSGRALSRPSSLSTPAPRIFPWKSRCLPTTPSGTRTARPPATGIYIPDGPALPADSERRSPRRLVIITFDRNYGNKAANYKKRLQATTVPGPRLYTFLHRSRVPSHLEPTNSLPPGPPSTPLALHHRPPLSEFLTA